MRTIKLTGVKAKLTHFGNDGQKWTCKLAYQGMFDAGAIETPFPKVEIHNAICQGRGTAKLTVDVEGRLVSWREQLAPVTVADESDPDQWAAYSLALDALWAEARMCTCDGNEVVWEYQGALVQGDLFGKEASE